MQVMFGWQETQEKIKKKTLQSHRRKPKFSSFTFPRAKSKETNVNKLTNRTKKEKEVQKRNTPSEKEKKEKKREKERLVYDVRFETGEICKELLWVRN